MREDISDFNMEKIYRQLASFLLQLFKLDFDRIGSLPSPYPETQGSSTLARPITFKVHTILQNGGVTIFGTSCYLLLPFSCQSARGQREYDKGGIHRAVF